MAKPIYDLQNLVHLAGHFIRDEADGKVYRVLRNVSGGALANGDVVVYTGTDPAGINATTTTVANDVRVAGVCIDAPANNEFFRCQVEGQHSAVKIIPAGGAIAQGAQLGTHTTARTANAASTSVGVVLGLSLATHASSTTQTTGPVLIRLR